MAKAAPAEQLRLLDVAALDSQATMLTRQIAEATADAQLPQPKPPSPKPAQRRPRCSSRSMPRPRH